MISHPWARLAERGDVAAVISRRRGGPYDLRAVNFYNILAKGVTLPLPRTTRSKGEEQL